MHVHPALPADRDQMLELWERSVRATHHFLAASDITELRPLVATALATEPPGWWVLRSDANLLIGFLGCGGRSIEALFLDPGHQRRGGGRLLVAHAQSLMPGELMVDVNEQNEAALGFYLALGFEITGRSPTDDGGRPFPILHLRRTGPGAS